MLHCAQVFQTPTKNLKGRGLGLGPVSTDNSLKSIYSKGVAMLCKTAEHVWQ